MTKYLVKASYNQDGIKGVMKDGGSARVSAIEKLAEGMGGSLESLYFAFGDADVYVTFDVPGHAQAAAIAAAVGSSGAFSSYETIVLLTPEEIDEAMKLGVDYRPPGG